MAPVQQHRRGGHAVGGERTRHGRRLTALHHDHRKVQVAGCLDARAARAGSEAARQRGALLRLQARVPQIGDVRGLGSMLAIELVTDPGTKEADADLAQRVIAKARDRGLLLLTCGPHKNVVRLLPPLTATAEEVTSGVAMLEAAVLDAINSAS